MPMPATEHAGMSMPMDQGHEMDMSFGPIADTQEASGTAWQPEATPMPPIIRRWVTGRQ